MSPLHTFSFIVTCYNGQEFVKPCLESILGQDYPQAHYEVLFIDDGSTDASHASASNFKKAYQNLSLYRIANSGLEKACNIGFRHARYDFLVRVDVDDMLAPGFLSSMNEAISKFREYDFYYCKSYYEYYSQDKQLFKTLPDFDKDEIFDRGDFFATGTAYRKQDLVHAGYYHEDVKNCGLENYNLILRLLSTGKTGLAVEKAAFYYRRHSTNMSTVKRDAIIAYGKKLLRFYQREYRTNQFHPYGLKFALI